MTILRKIVFIFITLVFSASLPTIGCAMENAFYILHTTSKSGAAFTRIARNSLEKNYKSINILISQAYTINENGNVTGFVDTETLQFVNQHAMKLMALVTNVGFDNKKTHQFLSNSTAQNNAIATILAVCKQNHFYGVQFDFEGVSVKDKAGLTNFFQNASKVLHQNGFAVSFAVVPLIEGEAESTGFQLKKYENWGGVYDLKALSEISDFITIMSYDQHSQGTPPGPSAGALWVAATIQYALKFIPANKISLGIPTGSGHWYLTHDIHNHYLFMELADISYKEAINLAHKYHAQFMWDQNNKIKYTFYLHNWLNEYIFLEDAKSFKEKIKLAKKYHLRGISVFDLGNEDPNIWKVLA